MKLTILCDVDEVCADMNGELLRRYNARFDDNLTVWDLTDWDYTQFVKPECGNQIYDILREDDFYDDVVPITGALNGVETLRAMGHEVVFVSSCLTNTHDAKLRWLMRHGFVPQGFRSKRFIPAAEKWRVMGHVLIDDGPHNITEWAENKTFAPSILFQQPHNSFFSTPPGCSRAYGWINVLEKVDEISRAFNTSYPC